VEYSCKVIVMLRGAIFLRLAKVARIKVLLSAMVVLLAACTTTRDERIGLYRDYCTKVGYAPNSEGLHDCIVQLETHRSSYARHHH
jgi:hypothetical protein